MFILLGYKQEKTRLVLELKEFSPVKEHVQLAISARKIKSREGSPLTTASKDPMAQVQGVAGRSPCSLPSLPEMFPGLRACALSIWLGPYSASPTYNINSLQQLFEF